MKIDFSKVIFIDKSWVKFDGLRQQGDSSVTICAGIVNQTSTGPFKVNGVKLNNANYCNFMDKDFLS